jgi:hypothetical protein
MNKLAPMFRFTIRDLLWLMVVAGMGLFVGCPAGGFVGTYIVVNRTKTAIHDLTLSADGHQRSWPITESGQGWIVDEHPGMGRSSRKIRVSWKNSDGEIWQTQIDFKKETGYRCGGRLIIEINEGDRFCWWLTREMAGTVDSLEKLPSTDATP